MNEEEKVSALLTEPLLERGYRLVSVHYCVNADGPQLQVTVDRTEPISLDDIVALSDPISALLDKEDPIAGAYTLDVSSLGAEKPIAPSELSDYVGRYVNLHLSHPYHGENIVEGDLVSILNAQVTLRLNKKGRSISIEFPLGDVDKARLAIKF